MPPSGLKGERVVGVVVRYGGEVAGATSSPQALFSTTYGASFAQSYAVEAPHPARNARRPRVCETPNESCALRTAGKPRRTSRRIPLGEIKEGHSSLKIEIDALQTNP